MTAGPATLLALVATILATLVWYLVLQPKPNFNAVIAQFLFGGLLALVVLAGPLIKLP